MTSLINAVHRKIDNATWYKSPGEFDIARLISQRRWLKLRTVIETSDPDFLRNEFKETLHHLIKSHHPSIVHYACMFRPPLSIIEALVDAHKESIFLMDSNLWQPLHVACHHGASIDVIRYILKKSPSAVQQIDISGKTAIYLVLDRIKRKQCAEVVNVVKLIAKAYPTGITTETFDGVSALELVILKKTDVHLFEIMHRTIERERRKCNHELLLSQLKVDSDLYYPFSYSTSDNYPIECKHIK